MSSEVVIKVLVRAASKHGATSQIADVMATALKAPEGDFRDRGEIDRWARGIAAHLSAFSPASLPE